MYLSIIIPLYNEEKLIPIVIERISEVKFPEFVSEYEIIIVDDASSDESLNIAKDIANKNKHIRVFSHEKNLGKGAATRTGIKMIKGNVILVQDADLELTPSDIPSMLVAMHELDVEFVNGSRYLPGIARPLYTYSRYLANKFFTFLTSVLINVKLTDMACGYKLVHAKLLNSLQLRENRFGFEAELIIKALRVKKNNITEVPVQYFPRNRGEGKKLKFTDGFKILWIIFKYSLFIKK